MSYPVDFLVPFTTDNLFDYLARALNKAMAASVLWTKTRRRVYERAHVCPFKWLAYAGHTLSLWERIRAPNPPSRIHVKPGQRRDGLRSALFRILRASVSAGGDRRPENRAGGQRRSSVADILLSIRHTWVTNEPEQGFCSFQLTHLHHRASSCCFSTKKLGAQTCHLLFGWLGSSRSSWRWRWS